jgi:hypothetical protein|tara:strand:- start:4317 stop:4736 length:420 start_codon:yes stop_codon:yes gene_type:complete
MAQYFAIVRGEKKRVEAMLEGINAQAFFEKDEDTGKVLHDPVSGEARAYWAVARPVQLVEITVKEQDAMELLRFLPWSVDRKKYPRWLSAAIRRGLKLLPAPKKLFEQGVFRLIQKAHVSMHLIGWKRDARDAEGREKL